MGSATILRAEGDHRGPSREHRLAWYTSRMKAARSIRLEDVVAVVFVGLCALFGIELVHFMQTGAWVIHGGTGEFDRWPQPPEQTLVLWIHSVGMLLWIGAVLYQLRTRGRGAHVMVGRVGAGLMLVSLALAWRPAMVSSVPALHGLVGLTLMDVTLIVNVVGIAAETLVGIFKVRDRRIVEHRQHLMVAVMFTAAPGLYRAYVIVLSWLMGPGDPVYETVWLHEVCASLAIVSGLALLLSKTFSGHRQVFQEPGKRPRPAWHRVSAGIMLSVSVALMLLYVVWLGDLAWMRWTGVEAEPFQRAAAPWFNLHGFG